MNPTLCELDLLEVVPYTDRSPQAGDVVLFVSPGGEQLVVHRIVRVEASGLRTRGESNSLDDPYTLAERDLIGQVVAAWRGRRRRIRGGRVGLTQAQWIRWLQAADRALSCLLHPLYCALAASGLLRRLVPARLRPRVVRFVVDGQQQLRLLVGHQVVGQYDPRRQQWQIRRPYRLLVDEATLPRAPSPLAAHDRSAMDRSIAPSDWQTAPPGSS
jgi:hypothetical protein